MRARSSTRRADAALRARGARRGRLRHDGHGQLPGPRPHPRRRAAGAGAARPGPAPAATASSWMAQAQALAELPVIFISAYDRAEPLARALDAGADDYLVKPFSATELTARVRAARRRAKPVRARRAGHRLPRPPRHARRPQADGNAAAARHRGWRTSVPGFALPRRLAGVERGRDACGGRLSRAGGGRGDWIRLVGSVAVSAAGRSCMAGAMRRRVVLEGASRC